MSVWRGWAWICVCAFCCTDAGAEEPAALVDSSSQAELASALEPLFRQVPIEAESANRSWCDPERFSLQLLEGTYFESGLGPHARDTYLPRIGAHNSSFDYAITNLRLGYRPFFSAAGEETWLDHLEVLADLNLADIYDGFGNVIVGPAAFVRYNGCIGTSLVPYVQGGAGIIYTDAYQDRQQRIIGQGLEFLLEVEVGVRWQMSDTLSLDVEGGFQHISNACLADRNGGMNAFGGSIGVTWRFGRRRED